MSRLTLSPPLAVRAVTELVQVQVARSARTNQTSVMVYYYVQPRTVDPGKLAKGLSDTPNRLDVTDLFMQRCGRRVQFNHTL